MVGGGLIVSTLFSDSYFSMKKGSGGPKILDFSYYIINFQKIEDFFWFFSVVLGYLEEAGTINPLLKLHPEDVKDLRDNKDDDQLWTMDLDILKMKYVLEFALFISNQSYLDILKMKYVLEFALFISNQIYDSLLMIHKIFTKYCRLY